MKLIPTIKSPMMSQVPLTPSANKMKRPLIAIALFACSVSLLGCNQTTPSAQTPSAEPTSVSSPVSSPVSTTKPNTTQTSPVVKKTPIAQKPSTPVTDLEPEVGVIQQIQQGDLMCYITFTDEGGKERTVGATFELCESPQQYLNQQVRLIYGVRNVNDCQSNEPCGKTRRENVVVQLDRVDDAGRNLPDQDVTVLSNGKWTIKVGNRNSWSGVNGTGDLSYQGCNSKQECLDLTGGQVTCRNGTCATVWRNGNYTYTLTSEMTENSSSSPSTLIVAKNGNELQRIYDLR